MVIDPEPTEIKEDEKETKKLNSKLDRYIIFSFSCVIIYTIVSIVLAIHTGMQLDTLTTCVFACFGGELLACAMIKRFKLKDGGSRG